MSGSLVHEDRPVERLPEARPCSRAQQQQQFLKALGGRVHDARLNRGMTRKALADAAGVSERHLANLEHGTGNASIVVLLQVAQALGSSLGALFTVPAAE